MRELGNGLLEGVFLQDEPQLSLAMYMPLGFPFPAEYRLHVSWLCPLRQVSLQRLFCAFNEVNEGGCILRV